MRIEKNGKTITSLEEWERFGGPKRPGQWIEGRSAFELARAWIGTGVPTIPAPVRSLLDSREETRGLELDVAFSECRIAFDERDGEPCNADLASLGRTSAGRVALVIEAKADEQFALTVAEMLDITLERAAANPRSEGLDRIRDLARSLFGARSAGLPDISALRYQLLTATAGALAFAIEHRADWAALVVHEFITDKTNHEHQAQNRADLEQFVLRLSGTKPEFGSNLVGPFTVPGLPLFSRTVPLFAGKVVTDCRDPS